MEVARDLAKAMEARGEGVVLDQFGNAANPLAHFNVRGGRSQPGLGLARVVHVRSADVWWAGWAWFGAGGAWQRAF
jgi:hypothetical protein